MMLTVQDQKQYSVQGQVRDELGRPMWGKVVRAFEVDIRSETQLGEAITDSRGAYLIKYCPGSDGCSENSGPDLRVRVFTPGDNYPDGDPNDLAPFVLSEIHFNVSSEETINFFEGEGTFDEESEYELLEAALKTSMEDVLPTDLQEPDVEFLVGDTGEDKDKIEIYGTAHKLAVQAAVICAEWEADPESGLPGNSEFDLHAAVFYGWLRRGFSEDFSALFEHGAAELKEGVDVALEESLIPAWLGGEDTRRDLDARIDEHAFHERNKDGATPSTLINDLIELNDDDVTLMEEDKAAIIATLTNHTGTEDEFYDELLLALEDNNQKLNRVRLAFDVSRMSLGHTPLVKHLNQEILNGTNLGPEVVAEKTLEEWQAIVSAQDGTGAPVGVTETEYIEYLYRASEIKFPTTRIASRVLAET